MKQKLRLRQIIIDGQQLALSVKMSIGLQPAWLAKLFKPPSPSLFLYEQPAGAVTANSDADKLTVLEPIRPRRF